MTSERRHAEMRPLPHALSLVVPFYMIYRIYAHFRALNELLAGVGARERANLAIAVGAFTAIPLTFIATGAFRTGLPDAAPLLIAATCAAIVAGYGQHHLNTFLRSRPEGALVMRVGALEWIALVVFGTLMAGYLLASCTAGPPGRP